MSNTAILARGPTLRSLRHFFVRNVAVKPLACNSHDVSTTLAVLRAEFDAHPNTISTVAATALARLVAQTCQDDIAAALTPSQCHAVEWLDSRTRALTDPQDWLATIQIMIALYSTTDIDPDVVESFLYWL